MSFTEKLQQKWKSLAGWQKALIILILLIPLALDMGWGYMKGRNAREAAFILGCKEQAFKVIAAAGQTVNAEMTKRVTDSCTCSAKLVLSKYSDKDMENLPQNQTLQTEIQKLIMEQCAASQ